MRRRKSYSANSNVMAVYLHNRGAAADKRCAEQERERRKQLDRDESHRRRQERHEHYEALRLEKKERLRFEKADELLISYRLPNTVTPWVIDYMDAHRCDFRHVKREIFEPFASGKRSAAETIAMLATDKDGDGTNEYEQITLLFDWYDLRELGRPALIEYLLSAGPAVAEIEADLIKVIAGRDLTPAQVYDLICTADEAADPDPFVAQLVLDWDMGEEWVDPIVEVSRNYDMTFHEFQERLVPALLAEARLDTAAEQSALEAHAESERAAAQKTWLGRWLAGTVGFAGAWIIIPDSNWLFALVAAIGVLGISSILPAHTTGANFLWPSVATAIGAMAARFVGSAWSVQLLAILGSAATGMIATRFIEPGIPLPDSRRRDPHDLVRAASAQLMHEDARPSEPMDGFDRDDAQHQVQP